MVTEKTKHDTQNAVDHEVRQLKRIVKYVFIIWTVLIGVFLGYNLYSLKLQVYEIARAQARSYFNKDQAFRMWATSHGGVYVPIDERTPPNPYLSHVAERGYRS